MSTPFARTLRSLAADRSRAGLAGAAVSVALLLLWGGWLVLSRVPVLAVSREARIEAEARALPASTRVDGRIEAVRTALGQAVEEGEVLFELDAEVERRRLDEERARAEGLRGRRAALADERAAALRALDDARRDTASAVDEARARLRTAQAAADLAAEEAGADRRLHEQGLLPRSDLRRSESAAEQRAAEAEAARGLLARAEAQAARDEADRRVQLARLDGEIAELDAELRASARAAERLGAEVAWRVIRAPAAGSVGEMAPVGPGSVVAEGDVLATVVPRSALRVVAAFEPADVLGRIRRGQPAEVRLSGFPWLEHGMLPARVERVSSEVRDDLVWVHLAVEDDSSGSIPVQHGLPGEVRVELERVAPWVLVLRAVGRRIDGGEAR